jgi:hypothetical protein
MCLYDFFLFVFSIYVHIYVYRLLSVTTSVLFVIMYAFLFTRKYVKEPMDLGTVLMQVREMQEYVSNPEQFYTDLMLVWSNCMAFNPESTRFHHFAKE